MTIKKFLIDSGVLPNLLGFNYLVRAVEIVKGKGTMKVTQELYPRLAKEFKTTPGKVERAMRHIVTTKLKIQDYRKIGLIKVPTNSGLIYYFAMKKGEKL